MSINGARAIFSIMIAYVTHYMVLIGSPFLGKGGDIFFDTTCLMMTGSDFFFVVSGFLVCLKYEERFVNHTIKFIDYIRPKIIKIYPLVIVMAVLVYILEIKGKIEFGEYPLHEYKGDERYTLFNLILNILGLQCGWISEMDDRAINGPSWFVSILMICYAIHFLIAKYGKKLRIILYICMICLGVFIIVRESELPLLYSNNGRGYYCYFMGVLIAEVMERLNFKNIKVINVLSNIAALMSIILFIISYKCVWDGPVNSSNIMILGFYPIFLFTIVYNNFFYKIFSNRILVWLGNMSLEIFLCNIPTLLVIKYFMLKLNINVDLLNIKAYIVIIIISIFVAYIMKEFFVKNMSIMLQKLFGGREVEKNNYREIS
ncbi:MAG: acyltransferase [Lachnospiraceae bacterium]|nr:acyltransferase [Lachnospiraceae bacterium]